MGFTNEFKTPATEGARVKSTELSPDQKRWISDMVDTPYFSKEAPRRHGKTLALSAASIWCLCQGGKKRARVIFRTSGQRAATLDYDLTLKLCKMNGFPVHGNGDTLEITHAVTGSTIEFSWDDTGAFTNLIANLKPDPSCRVVIVFDEVTALVPETSLEAKRLLRRNPNLDYTIWEMHTPTSEGGYLPEEPRRDEGCSVC